MFHFYAPWKRQKNWSKKIWEKWFEPKFLHLDLMLSQLLKCKHFLTFRRKTGCYCNCLNAITFLIFAEKLWIYMPYNRESRIEYRFIQIGQKLALLLETPAKNPKTRQWQKFIQLVSIMMLYCHAKNEVKTILVIFHVNESRVTERTLWPKLKKQLNNLK